MKRSLPVTFALGLFFVACGSSQQQSTIGPTSPFTPEMLRVFDDSVDYVENVEDLGGRVASDWRRQIDGLTRASDLIAVVRIETVTTRRDPNGSDAYVLSAVARDAVKGELPPDRHVELHVGQGQVGYNTVRGNEARLQSRDFVMFAKWYDDPSGVRAHWHLSPSTPPLLQRVRDMIESGAVTSVR